MAGIAGVIILAERLPEKIALKTTPEDGEKRQWAKRSLFGQISIRSITKANTVVKELSKQGYIKYCY